MSKWNRLESLIQWTGMSVNAFALNIGLKRAENLYQIKRGNNGISLDLANMIVLKYPQVSKMWLLTGEGEMFHSDGSDFVEDPLPKGSAIPFYDSSYFHMAGTKPLYHLSLPPYSGCDLAIKWSGNSMSPAIPSGALVLLRRIELRSVLWGMTHLVVTADFFTVRDLRIVPERDGFLRLVPRNLVDFDEVILSLNDVRELYLVEGVIYSL